MIGGPEVDSDVPLVSMVPPAHASVFVASASSAPETDVYLREHQRERERERERVPATKAINKYSSQHQVP
jgi:hypothetical protein